MIDSRFLNSQESTSYYFKSITYLEIYLNINQYYYIKLNFTRKNTFHKKMYKILTIIVVLTV